MTQLARSFSPLEPRRLCSIMNVIDQWESRLSSAVSMFARGPMSLRDSTPLWGPRNRHSLPLLGSGIAVPAVRIRFDGMWDYCFLAKPYLGTPHCSSTKAANSRWRFWTALCHSLLSGACRRRRCFRFARGIHPSRVPAPLNRVWPWDKVCLSGGSTAEARGEYFPSATSL